MKPITAIALGIAAAALGWIVILKNHEEQVKFWHYIETGERFGCEAEWASPGETGQSWLFSVPWIKSRVTGKIHEYPLMG